MSDHDLFRWQQDGGHGLSIDQSSSAVVAHEVLSEHEICQTQDHAVFMGTVLARRRFVLFLSLILLVLGGLWFRAFWMQVVNGAQYQELAERNRLRHDLLLPRRGLIHDREGRLLAQNKPAFDVQAIEEDLPVEPAMRDEALGQVARSLGMPVEDIRQLFASSTDPQASVVLKRDIPYEQAIGLHVLTATIPAVRVVVQNKREYPISTDLLSLSHILGYVGGINPEELRTHQSEGYRQTDLIGKIGVEAVYESSLRGQPGERVYEVDAHHRITNVVGETAPQDGHDLTLALDLDLQRVAEQSLYQQVKQLKTYRGAVVVLDPRDGSVLAAVSLPAYDNNLFSGTVSSTAYHRLLDDPDRPLVARAWAGVYPSGSTIKPVVATAALAEHIITPETSVLSSGGVRVGPWFFPDWKPGGHGPTNVRRALAWSVNTFFYTIGGGYQHFVGLGVDRIVDWMHRFGLGTKTGLDVVGESSGLVPTQSWKQQIKKEPWYIGDTYNLSIGQGDLLVTPLQVAVFTAIVANGGHTIVPHLILTPSASSTRQVVALPEIIQTVQQGMRDTVVYGSGRALNNFPVPVAGKTGTAQWRNDRANHAWFTAYAPADHPEIVVTVFLEEGQEGSLTAVPVARDVLNVWLAKRSRLTPFSY